MPLTRKKPISRSTKPIKRTRIKRKPRPASETLRIYGPPARRKFVLAMPCAACGIEGFTEQAHCPPTIEAGGTGYKADAKWIAPLCGYRMRSGQTTSSQTWYCGCHTLHDQHYEEFTRRFPNLDMQVVAEETERRWLAFSGSPRKKEQT